MNKENMTPKEIVNYLDDYIIGQNDAKRSIAIALRNRYRRMKLPKEIQDEITPKNILMIGSTGVGKTEIARRMAKMMNLPFVKVEASKYTEVGFVGRDVESMVRDLVSASILLVEKQAKIDNQEKINNYIIDKITNILIPPLPKLASEEKKKEYDKSYEKMRKKVESGEADELKIDIEIQEKFEGLDSGMSPEIIKVQESIIKVLNKSTKNKKTLSVKEAKIALKEEASESILDMSNIQELGLKKAELSGIIFIDEIDKIATGSKENRADPSKEGVQRDLLPIIEGSVVNTKWGNIKTDYILFVAAGAFHFSKPSDLIPELQGRFPIRVELDSLDKESMFKILTQTKSSLIKQYQALLSAENVELEFEQEALEEIANLAFIANQKTEDIGARRLHTILEKVLEDFSFNANEYVNKKIIITKQIVLEKLENLVENTDLTRYIL